MFMDIVNSWTKAKHHIVCLCIVFLDMFLGNNVGKITSSITTYDIKLALTLLYGHFEYTIMPFCCARGFLAYDIELYFASCVGHLQNT